MGVGLLGFFHFRMRMTEWPTLSTAPLPLPHQLALAKKAAAHPNDGAIEHAGLHRLWGREKCRA